ncbi:hypothetical protein [Methanosarcina sp. UBA5]|uniref:hypothetical protein n=1 Tax=Methanosarcina sp. UBA5 TaxID=1915593 RepID=UPI0025DF0478|nr:hypothetical protein [Methanosarcina sp. UBA5]
MFDRSPLVIHEQFFDGKYGLSLTTASSDDLDFVPGIMDNFIVHCGGKTIGGMGCSVAKGPKAMEAATVKIA